MKNLILLAAATIALFVLTAITCPSFLEAIANIFNLAIAVPASVIFIVVLIAITRRDASKK